MRPVVKIGIAVVAVGLMGAAGTMTMGLPIAITNAALQKLPANPSVAVFPVLRLGVNSVGDAPVSWWKQQSGSCATPSAGSCVNGSDGNSFVIIAPADGVDIREWGAKCDGTTNDTASINSAFTSATHKFLFPPSSCIVTTLNSPPANSILQGANEYNSMIVTSSSTGDVLPITNSNVKVDRLGFSTSTTRTGGCYIHIQASTITLTNFYLINGYCAYKVDDGTSVTTVDHGYIYNSVGSGQSVVTYGSGTGAGPLAAYFGHTIINSTTPTQTNITVSNVGDLFLDYVQSLSATIDLMVNPASGQSVVSLKTNASFFDHGGTNMWVVPSGTGSVGRSEFVNTWFGSGTTNGAVLDGGTGSAIVNGLQFTNCQFVLSGGTGLVVQNRTENITVSDSIFAGNVDGIFDNRSATFNGLFLINNNIGASGLLGGNTTGYIGQGAGDFLILNGNMVSGNTTSYNLTNSGTHNVITHNIGINPVGTSTPTPGASPWTFGNGPTPATMYLFAGTISSVSVNGASLFNAAGTPLVIPLAPNDVVVVIYTVAPTVHVLTQ